MYLMYRVMIVLSLALMYIINHDNVPNHLDACISYKLNCLLIYISHIGNMYFLTDSWTDNFSLAMC